MTKKKQEQAPLTIPEPLATAVVASLAMRDLFRLRHMHPEAISDCDVEQMHKVLGRRIRRALDDSFFDDIRKDLDAEVELEDRTAGRKLTILCLALLEAWPGSQLRQTGSESREERFERAFVECQWVADQPMINAIDQLSQAKARSQIDIEIVQERRRSMQCIQAHWELCRSIVLNLAESRVGRRPKPLIHHIQVLRARIRSYFAHVAHIEGGERASTIVESLLATVMEGDIDDLSSVTEWTRHQVQIVDDYLERTRREGGSKRFPLMIGEERLLSRLKQDIDDYFRCLDIELANTANQDANSRTERSERLGEPDSQHDVFPTPEGATWRDVRMRFLDGHTVSVQIGDENRVLNYTHMGMDDRRNSNPNKQWKLLRAFAEGGGTLDWSSPASDPKNQKRRESLARRLREFFRIDEDPFDLTKNRKGWRTKFLISWPK